MLGITTEILFDKFEILEVLKKDEHAAVFLANHIYLSKKIILKVLNTQKISDHALVERFRREAKLLAKLDHPNIIKVLDFGTAKEYFYISFEYIDGVSLRNVLKTKTLDQGQKEKLMMQLLKSLDFAHSYQIVHRDIKPENIFIDKNFNLKLGDFGLALSAEDNFVTNPYSIVGTPSYMSPEQVRGAKLNNQSDLFSAGVVLFELFTGKNPFLKENVSLTLNEIIGFDEENLKTQTEKLSEPLNKILTRLLQKNLARRYSSAKEILNELNIENEYPTITAEQFEKENNRSKRRLLAAIIISVIAISILVLLRIEKPTKENIPDNVEQKINTEGNQTSKQIPVVKKDEQPAMQDDANKDNLINPLIDQNDNNKIEQAKNPLAVRYGQLAIDIRPYAEVYIDGEKVGLSPFNKPLTYQEGEHTIKLIHPDYPVYTDVFKINPGETTRLKISLESTIGYIRCRVLPWGNVYVNDDFKGTTPLPEKELIRVAPGPVRLVIKHPDYREVDTTFTISRGDTLNFRYTLRK
ncbi:MAG: serine/threonine-protein kinase [Bacteroidota bacterium]